MSDDERSPTRQIHTPVRPDWVCKTSGRPWPDEDCQHYLDAMYPNTPAVLRAIMESYAVLAKRDQPARAAELEDRILGWLTEPA